jgi:energy-converting hydrogenase Eha subunit A
MHSQIFQILSSVEETLIDLLFSCSPVALDQSTMSQEKPAKDQDKDGIVYPTGLKLALLITSIFIGMFLVSLVY